MIVYLLSFLDMLTATVLLTHVNFGFFPFPVVLVHGIYLGIKGVLFASRGDFGSKIDVLCSIYIILVAFGLLINKGIVMAVFFWLVIKALLGFVPMK